MIPGSAEPRFPGYDVLAQEPNWDRETAAVVLRRLAPRVTLEFFTVEEEPTARALCDRLLGQDDEPRVPVVELVGERLLRGEGDGYRYADMPEDGEAWRRSLEALDAESRERYGRPFWDAAVEQQNGLLEDIRATKGDWRGLPASRVFGLWLRYACDAFYSHPWAWNEIGFGGPAYPRGYKNLGLDKRESWEVADVRPDRPSEGGGEGSAS